MIDIQQIQSVVDNLLSLNRNITVLISQHTQSLEEQKKVQVSTDSDPVQKCSCHKPRNKVYRIASQAKMARRKRRLRKVVALREAKNNKIGTPLPNGEEGSFRDITPEHFSETGENETIASSSYDNQQETIPRQAKRRLLE